MYVLKRSISLVILVVFPRLNFLIVAAKAARVNVRPAYLARRPNAVAPVIVSGTHFSDFLTLVPSRFDECVEFIMEYGKDWVFETYST